MPRDYQKLRDGNMNVDPRMVQEIKGNQGMMIEQGGSAGFMSAYGGADAYMAFAKMPENDRLVYAAVLDGYVQADEIAVVTGLDSKDVNKSLGGLAKVGLVDTGDGMATTTA